VLIVLASERDAAARRLVERWASHGARLMTVRDLSAPGWRYGGSNGREDCAVIGGEIIPRDAITGVVTRIAWVQPTDLPHIVEDDREYIAAEYVAFLTAWLDGLPCPVMNKPSPACLLGPTLTRERWLARAARAGLTLVSRQRWVPEPSDPLPQAAVSVVGERWFGDVAPELGAQAVRLAREAGVELLTALFSAADREAAFVGAELMTDVTPDIADALLSCLLQRAPEVRA